jgi:hypothetical protein
MLPAISSGRVLRTLEPRRGPMVDLPSAKGVSFPDRRQARSRGDQSRCLGCRPRDLPPHRSLRLAAVASVLTSLRVYDFDLPILGVGMALLLPDLTHLASEHERAVISRALRARCYSIQANPNLRCASLRRALILVDGSPYSIVINCVHKASHRSRPVSSRYRLPVFTLRRMRVMPRNH